MNVCPNDEWFLSQPLPTSHGFALGVLNLCCTEGHCELCSSVRRCKGGVPCWSGHLLEANMQEACRTYLKEYGDSLLEAWWLKNCLQFLGRGAVENWKAWVWKKTGQGSIGSWQSHSSPLLLGLMHCSEWCQGFFWDSECMAFASLCRFMANTEVMLAMYSCLLDRSEDELGLAG